MRGFLLFLLTGLALFLAVKADAHSPYFSDVMTCGEDAPYELRVLNGDGIVAPDPRALVVTDTQGWLLAYQEVASSAFLPWRDICAGVDLRAGLIWRPDPGSFGKGPRIVGETAEARTGRWRVAPGAEEYDNFGFSSDPLSAWQQIRLIARSTFQPLLILLGFTLSVGIVTLIRLNKSGPAGVWQKVSIALGQTVLFVALVLIGAAVLLTSPGEAPSLLFGIAVPPLILSWLGRRRT